MTQQAYGCTECSRWGRENCAVHSTIATYFGQGLFPYSLAAEQAAVKAFEAMERYWTDRAEREASYSQDTVE